MMWCCRGIGICQKLCTDTKPYLYIKQVVILVNYYKTNKKTNTSKYII